MKTRFLWRDGKWVDAAMLPRRQRPNGPMLIMDSTDAFKSMADGVYYESKSAYRRSLKDRGYVELGNDRPEAPVYEPPSAEADLHRAFAEHDA